MGRSNHAGGVEQGRRTLRSPDCPFPEEVPLNWNAWVRQIHRWLSMAFAVAVIVNIVALLREEPAVWVGLLALVPLALLLLTGLYLFVLPYVTEWSSRNRPSVSGPGRGRAHEGGSP